MNRTRVRKSPRSIEFGRNPLRAEPHTALAQRGTGVRHTIIIFQSAPVTGLDLQRWICDEVEPSIEVQAENQETSQLIHSIARQVATSHVCPATLVRELDSQLMFGTSLQEFPGGPVGCATAFPVIEIPVGLLYFARRPALKVRI